MRIPKLLFPIVREAARHLLRRPVVGICAIAENAVGEILLVKRGDTGEWAIPGGTLEWGESFGPAITRELFEEAGVRVTSLGELVGVYSRPDRDARFHAVTIVVRAQVSDIERAPGNALEIEAAQFFARDAIPRGLAYAMDDMIDDALAGRTRWE